MKPAAVTPAPVSSSNVTVAAAYQNTGPVTVTTTVETTVMRPTPTVPTRVGHETCTSVYHITEVGIVNK